MNLSEEQCVRLAIDAVETIRQQDQQTPVIVSFDQPWGEYLTRNQQDLSPLHFADALVRADLGINGIGLEINWGFHDENTLPRDLLELSQHIDRWSHLGLPLVIHLTISELPAEANEETSSMSNSDDTVSLTSRSRNILTVLASKPAVQALIWNQLTDSKSGSQPGAGLFDVNGKPKPILKDLHDLRHNYLS